MKRPKMTSLLLDSEDRKLLERLAKIQKVSKAQIIRLALRDFAEENGLMTTRLRMRNKAAAE